MSLNCFFFGFCFFFKLEEIAQVPVSWSWVCSFSVWVLQLFDSEASKNRCRRKWEETLVLVLEHLALPLSIYTGRSFVSRECFRSPTVVYKEACEENQAILERNHVQLRVCLMKQRWVVHCCVQTGRRVTHILFCWNTGLKVTRDPCIDYLVYLRLRGIKCSVNGEREI